MARRARHRIVLVPGFFGFTNLGRLRYFAHVYDFLTQRCAAVGADVRIDVVKTEPTSSLPRRAVRVLDTLARAPGGGREQVHLIGHSSGGLDIRLLATPGVRLPTTLDTERYAGRIRSVVTVATPHCGTPVASFFTSLLGQRLLQILSLSTIYVLRFGYLPLSALLKLGAIFSRLDNLGINSALLDQVFDQLFEDFSVRRRRAVQSLFAAVVKDQALLLQLAPQAMDVFNATVRDRCGVRYGSVITRGARPSLRSAWTTGADPSAQATHAVYRALYRLSTRTPRHRAPRLQRHHLGDLRRYYGELPTLSANDGVVPTRSQVWGDVVAAVQADHLDVIGHFDGADHVPPHFDWLTTGSGFGRHAFEKLWDTVLEFSLGVEVMGRSQRPAKGAPPRGTQRPRRSSPQRARGAWP